MIEFFAVILSLSFFVLMVLFLLGMISPKIVKRSSMNDVFKYYFGGGAAVFFLLLLVFSFIDTSPGDKAAVSQPSSVASPAAEPLSKKAEKVVSHSVIEKKCNLPIKCGLDVRLDSAISRAQLVDLALKLKKELSHEEQKAEKIFIHYWLPDMVLGAGSWASTDFTPELKVNIRGATSDQEQKSNQQIGADEKVVGKWAHNQLSATYTFIEKGGALFMHTMFSDGSSDTKELMKRKVNSQTRYYEKDDDSGEYYMINSDGVLEAHDEEGLIDTYTFRTLK